MAVAQVQASIALMKVSKFHKDNKDNFYASQNDVENNQRCYRRTSIWLESK